MKLLFANNALEITWNVAVAT